ncbi:MAG: DUF3786 domain-containing protein [Phycisphaerae bacterium]|nr:DUF3786 domain-containing protein [Phycisphaerae bacterium]
MQRDPRISIPPSQNNYADAVQHAVAHLGAQGSSQLELLGAKPNGNLWQLPVLNDTFDVDTKTGCVGASSGQPVGLPWRILTLHYLAVRGNVEKQIPSVGFADISAGRSYAGVYKARVISRLCATVGRTAETLCSAADNIGGVAIEDSDLGYDFDIFPQITLRLLWYAPDDEFPASASLLLPKNILSFFSVEDTVVLSESLIARLSGKDF